jgi:hypothetical protein
LFPSNVRTSLIDVYLQYLRQANDLAFMEEMKVLQMSLFERLKEERVQTSTAHALTK